MTTFERLADFAEGDFVAVTGFPHATQQAVMPLVAYRAGEIRPYGTCFAISPQGIALTARHVVDEALGLGNWTASAPPVSSDWAMGALYVRSPTLGDGDVPDLVGRILPVTKTNMCADLDVAALVLNLPVNSNTGEALQLPVFKLSPGLPDVGLACFGLGYHAMHWTSVETYRQVQQSYSATRGVIEEVHFPLRDQHFAPFPCFRTSSRFDPGMSGGPVTDASGAVIGVICSSLGQHDDGGYISYASAIGPALLLQIEARGASGQVGPAFLDRPEV